MTNPGAGSTERQDGADTVRAKQLVASFDNYLGAQSLVDRMSDGGFPVQHVSIVGDGLRTIEVITGRMTVWKAAGAGALSGAWFGALIGLVFTLFTTGPYGVWVLLWATLMGAVWGAVFGYAAHWSTRGQRDFSSVQSLEAQRYDVYVTAEYAQDASRYAQSS